MPGESASAVARAMFAETAPHSPESAVFLTAEGRAETFAPLARPFPAPSHGEAARVRSPKIRFPEAGWRQRLREELFFGSLYWQGLKWYLFDHILDVWSLHKRDAALAASRGETLPIAKRREFFSYMRIMGIQGTYYVLGHSSLVDEKVMREARVAFQKYFVSPGVGGKEKAAFEAFMARALAYNRAGISQSNFRQRLRDALLKGSLKLAAELAPYFDSLVSESLAEETAEFQKNKQAEVLTSFQQAVEETLREENPAAPGGVLAAVLIGSFAYGSANPRSDFDLELVSEGGQARAAEAFVKRIEERWGRGPYGKPHPVMVHERPYPLSKNLMLRIHDVPYLVFSVDPEIASYLSRGPADPPSFKTERRGSWVGRLLRWLQWGVVHLTTYWADFKDGADGSGAASRAISKI